MFGVVEERSKEKTEFSTQWRILREKQPIDTRVQGHTSLQHVKIVRNATQYHIHIQHLLAGKLEPFQFV